MSDLAFADRSLRAFPSKGYDAISASGTTLQTSNGPMLDLGGASHGTALLGHSHPAVVTAIHDAATRLIHVTTNVANPDRDAFLVALHRTLPAELTRSFLANSGTEAVECAIKLAITGGRTHIVAIHGGFHGRTMGALAATSSEAYRAPFQGRLGETTFVPADDIEALDAAIRPGTAAVILEPILGEGGIHPLSHEFLQAARRLTTERGALLIADEVQTGFRTGTPLAIMAAGIMPDIVTLGKGLAGGLPIGICSVTEAVARTLPPAGHGSTYGGSPLVCAAGRAMLDAWTDTDALDVERRIRAAIGNLQHPAIEGLRGRGAMLAISLRTRAPAVLASWEALGVAALPAGPRAIRILPPLTITDDDIDTMVDTLRQALPGGA